MGVFVHQCMLQYCSALAAYDNNIIAAPVFFCVVSQGRSIFGEVGSPFLKKIITKRAHLHFEFHAGHNSDFVRELQEYGNVAGSLRSDKSTAGC
jgi:hypothetical protein